MLVYESFDSSSYLEHYGVLGMKWGIRKDRQGTYDRASRKLGKLDAKAKKYQEKADKKKSKYYTKEVNAQTSLLFKRQRLKSAGRTAVRAYKNEIKANRATNKAYKWSMKMGKVFADGEKMSATDPHLREVGKKYANMTLNDIRDMSVNSSKFLSASQKAFATSANYRNFTNSLNDPEAWNKYNQAWLYENS